MTDQDTARLAAIREMRNEISPGPWVVDPWPQDVFGPMGGICYDMLEQDATFIASAPESIDWLLALVGRLERERAGLQRERKSVVGTVEILERQRDHARAWVMYLQSHNNWYSGECPLPEPMPLAAADNDGWVPE